MSQLAEQPGRAESAPSSGQNFERITGHIALERMASLPVQAQKALEIAGRSWHPEEAESLSILFNEHTEVGDERVEPALRHLRTLLSIYAPDRSNNTLELAVEWEALSQVTGFGLKDHEERLSVAELYELSDVFAEKHVITHEIAAVEEGETEFVREERIVRSGPTVFFDACYALLHKERRTTEAARQTSPQENDDVRRQTIENLSPDEQRRHRWLTTILGAGESSPDKALMLLGHFSEDEGAAWPTVTRDAMSHFANNVQNVLRYWERHLEGLDALGIEHLRSGERYMLRETVANPKDGAAMPKTFRSFMDATLARQDTLTREQLMAARDHTLRQLARVAGIRGRG